METKNEVTPGDEFHHMVLINVFNEIWLEYHHFIVEKVFKKSCRVKTLEEVGCHFCGNKPLDQLQTLMDGKNKKVQTYFKSLEEATRYWEDSARAHYNDWRKQIEGYTPKHPDYKYLLFNIELMGAYAKLLSDYTPEKHKKLSNWKNSKYKKFKRGRFKL